MANFTCGLCKQTKALNNFYCKMFLVSAYIWEKPQFCNMCDQCFRELKRVLTKDYLTTQDKQSLIDKWTVKI